MTLGQLRVGIAIAEDKYQEPRLPDGTFLVEMSQEHAVEFYNDPETAKMIANAKRCGHPGVIFGCRLETNNARGALVSLRGNSRVFVFNADRWRET